ncbi:hypothetical protein N288_09370 [Bacillus infantis NRRL B-14911]|uniref:Uncharacterized protein n=1 Tax=Bacillus infantis NRRL B-14911 TaxID=1367477 RepID=U5L8S9_9BACI|nr:hypothetical protein N288_09370 [Bacillus infantis NRRL B-14911]
MKQAMTEILLDLNEFPRLPALRQILAQSCPTPL